MQAAQDPHEREEQGPEKREELCRLEYEVGPDTPPCTDRDWYGSENENASEIGVGLRMGQRD
jgi:hypothetical protein